MKRLCCLSIALFLIWGLAPSVQADSPLAFSGGIGTFLSNSIHTYVDSDSYTVYAESGQTVTLDLTYTGICGWASARLDVAIGVSVGTIDVPPSGTSGVVNISGTQTYSRVMPTTGPFQISLTINSVAFGGIPSGCNLTYDMTVTGATLSSITSNDATLAAEEASGLQRVSDNALPIIIYTPTPAGVADGAMFIDIRDLNAESLLYIAANTLLALPEFPAINTLISSTSDGFITVYQLTTGEFQVNVGPLVDGKIHVIIFDGIPRTHTYGYTWAE
ncbi:MAG: hypothetical protein HY862_06585 [Chloroflexi bacterium]|nr:hypothetical protein [Chloroflexota bacterium]